jgi:hypothetical protein
MPFTLADESIWNNFVFFISVFNALKVLVACTEPVDDDDLVNIFCTFDIAFTEANAENALFKKVISSLKATNNNNNGDIAVVTIS